MNIQTVVLTAPRPKRTLERTLRSLEAAGWAGREGLMADIRVYHDSGSSGHFRAYMEALRYTLQHDATADAYFIVEDDVVFCRGLREYLERTLWPGSVERIALCSPYCPKAYRQRRLGWDSSGSGRGWRLAGSQAWIFPPQAVWAVLAEVAPVASRHNADWEIGKWATATGRRIWYHTPSLAQHVGLGNSVLGDSLVSDIRLAGDFIGEDGDAMDLLGGPQ
jgi:hypothetical protein